MTPSITPLPGGPEITFFGIVDTNGRVRPPIGLDGRGRPVYLRDQSRNFLIVVEAKPGPNGFPVGQTVLQSNPKDPTVRPDLQIEASQPLGDGSAVVCDKGPDLLGGVPRIDPPDYDPNSQQIADALNDLACRFVPRGRTEDACTLDDLSNASFVSFETTVQFCFEPAVGLEVAFPIGDTVLTARVRNTNRGLGDPIQIVVRVGG